MHLCLRHGSLDLDIKEFLKYYRENFPRASILPKMHLLEDHMVDWLRQFHMAPGIMGEQGAESVHAHLNDLVRSYATMPNKLERLKQLFSMYQVETDPSLQALKPTVKTRKRKRVSS